eukprot:TRINITY_DN37853_c0_g1_i1.p1 TRINITY_DN37853_c0_g1~~TRINITY_DN37853_c0_g1_i1.p1  ORF type:complete len:138 (+),score=33.77 TRINITY_DN37853_c0_g1_i1:59-472(+)
MVSAVSYVRNFFFQAEDGIRDHAQSRGLGDVYKRQVSTQSTWEIFCKVHNQFLCHHCCMQQHQNCDIISVDEFIDMKLKFIKQLRSTKIKTFIENRNDQRQKLIDIICLLYTSDAADDMQCVDLGGRRIIKKKKNNY